MSTFFPKHTVHWHFEEPTILRRFSISIWEVAVLTGVTLRLYRAMEITSGSAPSQLEVETDVITSARYNRSVTPVRTATSQIEIENRRRIVGSSKCHWTVCFGKNV